LFQNYNVFGSFIIHILYTGCAKIKKKIIPAPKGLFGYADEKHNWHHPTAETFLFRLILSFIVYTQKVAEFVTRTPDVLLARRLFKSADHDRQQKHPLTKVAVKENPLTFYS